MKKSHKNLKNEKSCEERCEIFLKQVEERVAHLEKELNNKVDEKRVNELIAAAKLAKSTSAQTDSKIMSNKVKEVIQNQVKEPNLEAKEREKRLDNVIIFNLTESTSQLKTTQKATPRTTNPGIMHRNRPQLHRNRHHAYGNP